MTSKPAVSTRVATWLTLAAIGGVLGAGLGYGGGRLVKTGMILSDTLAWSDLLAIMLSVLLLGVGVTVFLGSLSARATGLMIDPSGETVGRPQQARFYRLQAAVMALAGLMLAAPVLTTALPPAVTEAARGPVLAAMVVLFAVQSLLNLRLWRQADEFLRSLIAQTSILCFWILQSLLFLWAAAEKLHFLPALTTWDSMAVLMSVYLCASAFVSFRNGAQG